MSLLQNVLVDDNSVKILRKDRIHTAYLQNTKQTISNFPYVFSGSLQWCTCLPDAAISSVQVKTCSISRDHHIQFHGRNNLLKHSENLWVMTVLHSGMSVLKKVSANVSFGWLMRVIIKQRSLTCASPVIANAKYHYEISHLKDKGELTFSSDRICEDYIAKNVTNHEVLRTQLPRLPPKLLTAVQHRMSFYRPSKKQQS